MTKVLRLLKASVFSRSRTLRYFSSESAILEEPSPSLLDLRVGFIKQCTKHPDADKLYVSKISISNDSSDEFTELKGDELTVCSGLVNYIEREELLHQKVVVLVNLKPSKMRGIKSEAMILAAEKTESNDVKVAIVRSPNSASIGASLYFKPFIGNHPIKRLKSKVWDELQKHLFTDDEGRVIYKDVNNTYYLTSEEADEPATATISNSTVR